MKYIKLALVFSVLLFATQFSYGQEKVEVTSLHKEMKKGLQHGFKVNVPLEDLKTSEKEWGKYITGGAKVKVIRDKFGIEAVGARIDRVTRAPMNIYSVIYEDRAGVQLEAYFEVDSAFIVDDPMDSRTGAIRSFLYDFAIERYREAQGDLIKLENKNLETMIEDQEALIEQKNKLERTIGKSERGIESLKEDILSIESDQERKSKEIEKQKDLVFEYKEFPEELKVHKKELKNLQKQESKLEKEEESMHNDIDKYKETIRMSEREMSQNENLQSLKEKEIEDQKVKIKALEDLSGKIL